MNIKCNNFIKFAVIDDQLMDKGYNFDDID